jgi:hypothetical protein
MQANRYFAAAALALLPVFLWAQTDRGIITGTVTDASGAVVPAASVTVTNVATNASFTTLSTGTGNYTVPSLPPGTYRVRVESAGFKAFERSNVVVIAGGTARANAILELGQITESISVTSDLAQVQTETAKVSTQVSNKMVDELPLVVGGAMRGAFDLAIITPEANEPDIDSDKAFNVGGGQAGSYGATLDGVSILTSRFNSVQWANVNTPSVDAITEFSVETNGFKAEYGRASGGLLTFASKSGTNELHGTAYEFLRNNAVDARRFFEDEKGVYKQNDFGFSVGGPVYIPKVYDGRNKTFFFTSGEWFRNRVGASSGRFSVPTPEMYQGDFTNWVDGNGKQLPIYDPATQRPNPNGSGFVRSPFPGNMIPQGRFSPLIQNYLKVVGDAALPNNGAAPGTSDYVRNNYINNQGTALDPWTKYSVKADHNFSDNTKVSFLYNYGLHERTPGPDGFPGLPSVLNQNRIDNQKSDVYRATFTKVVSPNVVYYAFGGVNFWKENHNAITLDGDWESQGVCLKGAWDCNRNLLKADFSDYSGWVANAYDGSENFVFSFGNDITWIKNKHTIKFGYLWERLHYNGFGQQTIGGLVRGDRRSTSVPNNNNLSTGGGNGFASLLIGTSYSGGTENDRFVGQRWRSHAFYVQDDWKITPRLTLNLGLRYEFTLPPVEQKDKWSDFTPTKPNPTADGIPGALRFAGFGEGRENSRTLVDGWWGGIGPRLGLAYQLSNRTVVRTSAGISYGVVKTVTGSTHFEGSTLVFRPSSLDNGVTPAFLVDEGLPPYVRPPVIDPSFSNGNNTAFWDGEAVRLPANYQWTFSLQRQLGDDIVVEAAYNATVGAHLVAGLKNMNQLPFSVLEQYGRSLLTSSIDSPAAKAAGLVRPYSNIDCDFSSTCRPVSVGQALRPFPQYKTIQTRQGHGDKSGHSTYHAMMLKIEKRYSHGVTLQGSYVLSKMITDADSSDGDNTALDHYNRGLEKSIGQYDQTHNIKLNYIYELPFGRGKRWLNGGPASWVLGNWRVSGVQFYSSGFPLSLNNSVNFPIFNGRNAAFASTYDGWIASHDNPDWKGADRYFVAPSFFGSQPNELPGNTTRFNPKARYPWQNEVNFSLAKSFPVNESVRLDFRWEMFNAFNTPRFNPGSRNVQAPNFGQVTSTLNEPRRMQFGLKLYF